MIYFVRAEEKKTVYAITVFKVEADSPKEAKRKILENDDFIEVVESWDNCTEDIEYENSEQWQVEEGIK